MEPMSARDIIRQFEALPPEEQREVMAYVEQARKSKVDKASQQPMSVDDAGDHVFENYDELLAKLAK
jgi:hypothetical protein